jgi:hypothetical protein
MKPIHSNEKSSAPVPTPPSPPPQSFAARVLAAVALMQQAKDLLNLGDPSTATEVSRAVKFRKGGEQHVPVLAGLSRRYGVEVPSRPTADMTAQLEMATELEPARAMITELSTVVDGAYFNARSASWTTAISLYSMLKQGGRREPTLATALSPLQAFFAYRHRSVAEKTPKPSATEKAADKAQQRVQARIDKLQAQLERLQTARQPGDAVQAQGAGAGPHGA